MKAIHLLLCSLFFISLVVSANFDIANNGIQGKPFSQMTCDPHTVLNFTFSSNSQLTTCSVSTVCTVVSHVGCSQISLKTFFLQGTVMTLSNFWWAAQSNVKSFYAGTGVTIDAAAVFKFVSGSYTTYIYIGFTTSGQFTNANMVDLTSSKAPANTLKSFDGSGSLSVFNFFDQTDYNQWYSQTVGTTAILVNKFVYGISSIANADANVAHTQPETSLTNLGISSATAAATGKKLCYASYLNSENQIRQNVPLWFIWFFIFIYWLIYCFTDTKTKAITNAEKFTQNQWTCWSFYSIYHLAHEEFFTRLSRMTVILAQVTIQGVFVAAIISRQYMTGPGVLVWAAVISWLISIIFPFIFGNVFLKKIYQKYKIKFEYQKKIMDVLDKQKEKDRIKGYEDQIFTCSEKIYGYYHWFYCVVFALFVLCWPITISLIQSLPRTEFTYGWYWLIAIGVVFVWDYFIFQPILAGCFGTRQVIRNRGGFYYDIRLGEAYKQVADFE